MSGATLRIVLGAAADMLAVAGGVALFLRTGEMMWVIVGVLLSGMITLLFLVPALREARAERKE